MQQPHPDIAEDEAQPHEALREADLFPKKGLAPAADVFFSLARADYLNKGASGVCDQIRSVESRLPFALQGFDCDNGSEFLNFHLQRYFSDRPREIAFTRSRPYKKNDNAHAARARGNWNNNRCPSATQRCGRYRNYAPDSTSRMAAAISGSEKSKIGRPSSPLAYWPIRS